MFTQGLKISLLSILLMVSCIFTLPVAAYEKPQKITLVGGRPASDPRVQWMLSIYREAFLALGISIEFIEVPPRRAIKLAKRGEVDGDIARVSSYSTFNPELVAVSVPISRVFFVAFSSKENIKLDGWASLSEGNYRVECRLGVKICEKQVSRYVSEDRLSFSENINRATDKLLKARTDIYIENSALFYHALNERFAASLQQQVFEAGIMEEVTIHLHLHKKHQQLVKSIEQTLQQMKDQKRFEFYRKKYQINVLW